jgi:hypothetical protein
VATERKIAELAALEEKAAGQAARLYIGADPDAKQQMRRGLTETTRRITQLRTQIIEMM